MPRLALALLVLIALILPAVAWSGETYVDGYVRRDGTYVQPHWRTTPDSSYNNNWSTSPNVNPYTGQPGTRAPRPFDLNPGYQAPSGWGESPGTLSPSWMPRRR